MDHSAPHWDGDLVDPPDRADLHQWDDAAGGEGQVDRATDIDVGRTQIGATFVNGDLVPLAGEIDRKQ